MVKLYMRALFVFCSALLLAGCNIVGVVEVKDSDFAKGKDHVVKGALVVDVPSCGALEDSRKKSDALLRAISTIEDNFEGAKFDECFTQSFQSLARFAIPVPVYTGELPKEVGGLALARTDEHWLTVLANKKLKAQMGKAVPPITMRDVYLSVRYINDSDNPQPAKAQAIYANEKPLPRGVMTIPVSKDQHALFDLSDVAMDFLLTTGRYDILYKSE